MKQGQILAPMTLQAINNEAVSIPAQHDGLVHLQFRRYAGCPICSLHLHQIKTRISEVEAAGIQEVVIFHSPASELLKYKAGFPFNLIADPEMKLYRKFGVGTSWAALASPKTWLAASRGSAVMPVKTMRADGTRFGLPADFLISREGRVVDFKYGKHADDQWSVDELLTLAAKYQ